MIRALVTIWLAAVAMLAGWDAASLAARPETFETAYGLVLEYARPSTIVGFLAAVALTSAVAVVARLAGHDLPDWVAPATLCAYACVTAAFGISIFRLGWTAGTGALKWLGWSASCVGAAWLDEWHRKAPQRAAGMLDAIESAGMRIVRDDRGAHTAAVAVGLAAAAVGVVVLAVSEAIVLGLFGLLGLCIPAYFSYRASRSAAKRDDRKVVEDLVAQATARAKQADDDRQKNRTAMLKLERKFDALRTVTRRLLDVVHDLAPEHPVLDEAQAVLDDIAGIEAE